MSFVDEANATVGRMPYETAPNTAIAALRGQQATQAQAEAMTGWTPPVIVGDYGRNARVVTQADVDRLLDIEAKYHRLVRAIKDADAAF